MPALLFLTVAAAILSARLVAAAAPATTRLPGNLARAATITASSEFSGDYRAQFVADSDIPEASGKADLGRAWCVNGRTHLNGAEISFVWDNPVTVGEIIYYGRTAWFLQECWKDYEVFADQAVAPAARGTFEMRDGPQRIALPTAVNTSKLRLRFASSYGGPNPGASEIQIFSRRLTDRELQRLALRNVAGPAHVDPAALRSLITDMNQTHGVNYAAADSHARTLSRLETGSRENEETAAELPELQREVLLFDVERLVAIKRHEINATHVYTYHNEGFRAGGGLYVINLNSGSAEPVPQFREIIASPNGQILDCDLSFDGKTVLFSWRQREDEGYHLWTVNIDRSHLRQLTRGEWHDYNGCWLPDGGISFVSTRNAQFAYCWNSPVGVVHRMDAGGSNVVRLSANYLNDFTPHPLDDGRIIYARWEYVDKPAIPIQSLWTMNPDGTGLAGYFGNRVISPGTFMEARSVPGTEWIICTMTGHNGPTRGAIGVIDRSKGVNAQEAIWNVTPDVPVPRVNEGSGNFEGAKPYSSPVPLDKHRFLVSARGPVLVRNFSGTCQSVVLAKPENELQWFNAQPVKPRVQPRVIASTIPAAAEVTRLTSSAGKASEPPAVGSYAEIKDRSTATLFVQDIYAGLEPYVKRGEIKRLRVVREMPKTVRIDPDKRAFGFQFPVISCGATYAGKEVLGEVDVEPDGSACFEVPAGVPIYFMALDEHGRAVQRMRSFTHLMPGEVQGCVGCHDTRTPKAPIASSAIAPHLSPKKLQPPEWGVRGFEYAAIVQPVLDKHCVRCHSGATPDGKVDLSGDTTDFFNVSYEVLARGRKEYGEGQWDSPYVSWIPTYNGFEKNILEVTPKAWGSPRSKLADVILDGHRDHDGKVRVRMEDASQRRILAWIDLNVPYYGTSETTHPEALGSRRVYPPDLDKTLADVAKRRCIECHKDGKVPRQFWTRIQNPRLNSFLLAPLAKSADGTAACGKEIFATTNDPDYQAILRTFEPALASLREVPRTDMPGAKCSRAVNRSCK